MVAAVSFTYTAIYWLATGRFSTQIPRRAVQTVRTVCKVWTLGFGGMVELKQKSCQPVTFRSTGASALPVQPGRLAQLVRAPALQAGSRGFESLTAHQGIPSWRSGAIYQAPLFPEPQSSKAQPFLISYFKNSYSVPDQLSNWDG